jgi:hypothetical protein
MNYNDSCFSREREWVMLISADKLVSLLNSLGIQSADDVLQRHHDPRPIGDFVDRIMSRG